MGMSLKVDMHDNIAMKVNNYKELGLFKYIASVKNKLEPKLWVNIKFLNKIL